jgi:AraC-like DNA-binding protein
VSFDAIEWALLAPIANAMRKLVLVVLAYDGDGGWPSQKALADYCHIAERQVRRHLEVLKDEGYITWRRRRRASNVYELRPDIGFPVKDLSSEVGFNSSSSSDAQGVRSNGSRRPVKAPQMSGQDGRDPLGDRMREIGAWE